MRMGERREEGKRRREEGERRDERRDEEGREGEDGRRREGGNELEGEGAGSEASSNDYLRFLSADGSPPPSMVVGEGGGNKFE